MSDDLGPVLGHDFYARDVVAVARDLLGAVVVHESAQGSVAVRLTEVEAYAGDGDPGSHAFRGRTPRTEVMFGEGGFAYVYFSYGMHWCMNVVTGVVGVPGAVLLRSGEVVAGHDTARSRRTTSRSDRDLASGPARLTSALAIERAQNGVDLQTGALTLRRRRSVPSAIESGPRVGVGGAGAQTPWRFWLPDDPTVSAYRAHSPRRPAQQTPTGTRA